MKKRRRQFGAIEPVAPQPRVRRVFWYALGGAALAYFIFKAKDSAVFSNAAGYVNGKIAALSDAAFKLVLPKAGQPYADDILRVAHEENMSPFFIAAFMEQESGYGAGLSPKGPAGTGDAGHGRGLMQIDDRSHADFINKTDSSGTPLWQIPYYNIKEGVRIYKDGVAYFSAKPKTPTVTIAAGGSLNKRGLPAGTYTDPRPLSGDALVFAAIAAYNGGMGAALASMASGKPADFLTTKATRNGVSMAYATSVLARLKTLTAKVA